MAAPSKRESQTTLWPPVERFDHGAGEFAVGEMDVDDRGVDLFGIDMGQRGGDGFAADCDLIAERVEISFQHDGYERVVLDDQDGFQHASTLFMSLRRRCARGHGAGDG